MILDIYRKWGLGVMAQVDLDKRVHRNQDTRALGRMAFTIMKTFFDRIEKLGRITLTRRLFEEMIQFVLVNNEHVPDIHTMVLNERPPMVEIAAYQRKFSQQK
jgi:glucosyl-3-phosphoglycerate synthase